MASACSHTGVRRILNLKRRRLLYVIRVEPETAIITKLEKMMPVRGMSFPLATFCSADFILVRIALLRDPAIGPPDPGDQKESRQPAKRADG
jgi:hypothetical protein